MNQTYTQILAPPSHTFINCNNYRDPAIIRNFPCPYNIQTLNELSCDHVPIILRYRVHCYDLSLPQAIATRWQDFTFLLDQKQSLPTITESKQQD